MSSFKQRMGLQPLQKQLQVEAMDDQLRASLWNVLTKLVWNHWKPLDTASHYAHDVKMYAVAVHHLVEAIWLHHFRKPLDRMPPFKDAHARGDTGYSILRRIVLDDEWADAYDLIDFVVRNFAIKRARLDEALNVMLESENAGYRFINTQLTPITAPQEAEEVQTALDRSTTEVKQHLQAALSMLSDRKAPDFRNSIKESISAVEAAAQAVAGKPGATLGECMKAIKTKKDIHSAFEGALVKLYGYTSDAAGIRHALTEEGVKVTKADAQFMLVTCSAFTNYLWTLAAELGISIGK